jgi:hypothetical protein
MTSTITVSNRIQEFPTSLHNSHHNQLVTEFLQDKMLLGQVEEVPEKVRINSMNK